MKKLVSVLLVSLIVFSLVVFADEDGEEYSNTANIDYDYDVSYDENPTQEEVTSDKYDDISTSYSEEFDESKEAEYGEEFSEEPDPKYTEGKNDLNQNERNDTISVFVNGRKVYFDVPPMTINDRTMVPVRAIFEALGAVVTWDEDSRTATGVLDGDVINISIGHKYLLKNGDKVMLDSPAVVLSDRTLVPLRAIAESYDCSVSWEEETKVIEITK